MANSYERTFQSQYRKSPLFYPPLPKGTVLASDGLGSVESISTLVDKNNVKFYGAIGNGLVDDSAAIQACINANANDLVYFPEGVYRVSATLNITTPITLSGIGRLESINAPNNQLFSITSASDVQIFDLTLTSTVAESGRKEIIFVDNCSRILIQNVKIYVSVLPLSGRYQCIRFQDVTSFEIDKCHFEVIDPNYDVTLRELDPSGARHGAFIGFGCESGVITNNTSNKIGVPVMLQYTGSSGRPIEHITISNNVLRNSAHYGILLYTRDNELQYPIRYCTLSNNVIDTVYGTFFNSAVNNYSHGAGIYLQTTKNVTVSNNTVYNVCILTLNGSLVPASIGGLVRNEDTVISGNTCDTSQWYGIVASGTNVTVIGNTVKNIEQRCIFINRATHCSIVGNTLDNTDAVSITNGIRCFQTGEISRYVSIVGNTIRNCYFGILLDLFEYGSVIGNTIFQDREDYDVGQGIVLSDTSRYINCSNNVIKRANVGRGLFIGASDCAVTGNIIDGGTLNQHITLGPNSVRCLLDNNIIESPQPNNSTGVVTINAASTLVIQYFQPNMLIELSTAVGNISLLEFGLINRSPICFSLLSTVSGNTLVHLAPSVSPAFRFSLTAGSNLSMAANVIYTFRWSNSRNAWTQA